MGRIVVIALFFVLTLGAFAWAARTMLHDAAHEAAEPLYRHRDNFAATLRRATELDRYVLYMGDSTVLGRLQPSWVARSAVQLRRRGVETVVAAAPARDFFHHYCLLPAHLELEPEVVVLVANLRYLGHAAGRRTDLCSYLPPRTWIRAVTLPWYDRGVTLPHVALTRLLTVPWVEDWFRFVEGLRHLFAEQIDDPRRPKSVDERAARFLRGVVAVNREYTTRITERSPTVRMMRATVEEATRRGAKVIVVVAPVPLHQLQHITERRHLRFEERTAMLRRVVESAGGELIDLHGQLLRSAFRDAAGHYRASGHVRVANAVAARVHRALGLPPPKLLPVPDDPPRRRQPLIEP